MNLKPLIGPRPKHKRRCLNPIQESMNGYTLHEMWIVYQRKECNSCKEISHGYSSDCQQDCFIYRPLHFTIESNNDEIKKFSNKIGEGFFRPKTPITLGLDEFLMINIASEQEMGTVCVYIV